MYLISITFVILTASLILGFLYNYILMYTSVFSNSRIRTQQMEKPLSRKEFMKRTPLILSNILSLYLLSGVGLYFGQGLFDLSPSSFGIGAVHFLVLILIDDWCFYWLHRIMHENKFLNRHIHGVHHSASQPFPLDFIYAHPVEWLLGYSGAFLGVLILFIFSPVNVYAFWLWCIFKSMHELDIHSGVHSKITKYIPLMAGPEHHDFHHQRSKGNYASMLVLWDYLLGTWVNRKAKS